ncbi:unnamed protein product [Parnassius apollo]|uniref:(apollo) hypothetical protein n=1 Tax=Parnassius apollo TaxID=110799 RepID=A0A8S3Y4G8_PARAO|nr:unnamed protein product [Parnassius apollo]
MCGFLAKHDLPISLVDDFVSLLRNLFPESKCLDDVHLGKQKATNILRQVTGATYKQEVIDIMKNSYFNIIIDETTDLSVKKQLAIIITFFNSLTKKVEYRFFDLIDMIDGTAKGILQTIKGSFSKHEVPLDHVFGLTSDTTNVMMGKHNSVQALLKTEIPHLVVIECSCHLIHLATSYASRKLPKNLEDLCRNIPAYFHMSPKRTEALKQFQDFLKIDQHKLLSAANTRWLSLQACVDRILEQYDALKLFFTGAVFEDPSNTNDSILNSLNNPFNKALLHFMSYVFSITNDFNTFFQTKSPQLFILPVMVRKMLNTFLCNFVKKEHLNLSSDLKSLKQIDVTKTEIHLNNDHIYVGKEAHAILEDLKTKAPIKEVNKFYASCREFYVEIVLQIQKRFDLNEKLFDILKYVDPKIARNLEKQSVKDVFDKFNFLTTKCNMQKADNEWRNQALIDLKHFGVESEEELKNMPADIYWNKVLSMKDYHGNFIYENLEVVISVLLAVPSSNTEVERLFSILKNVKTDKRNRLSNETLNGLFHTKFGMQANNCSILEPNSAMISAAKYYKSNDSASKSSV